MWYYKLIRLKYQGFWVLRVARILISKVLEWNRGDNQNVPNLSRIDTKITWPVNWVLLFSKTIKKPKNFIWCFNGKITARKPSEIYSSLCHQKKPWKNASKI